MKATQQYFSMSLFVMLYKMVLTFESVVESLSATSQIRQATRSSTFLLVMLFMLYKVVLAFESVDEILKSNHSNESY